MTSITFPFYVGLPGPDKQIPLTDAEFRFSIKSTRALERSAGVGISVLLEKGQSVETLVLLVCYGLRWDDPKMTEDKAVNLIDDFIDAGGDVKKLTAALFDALGDSGVYGKAVTEEPAPLAPTAIH